MSIRPATHAGSWYSSNPATLERQITKFFNSTPVTSKPGARVLIGPHAGYTYCGAILSETYKTWDTSKVKTVFIFSPSHYVYFKGAKISKYHEYATPFGNIPVNHELINELVTLHPKEFQYMQSSTDDEEHGVEMHLPIFYQATKSLPQGIPSIVPILISASNESFEKKIAHIIKPYLSDPEFSFVVSSDFCHWGSRFQYTVYTADEELTKLKELSSHKVCKNMELPIYKSIEYLDKFAMRTLSNGSYKDWKNYIEETENTICGQKPIAIMVAALEDTRNKFQWNGYTQSNQVEGVNDSSVSYASGYLII